MANQAKVNPTYNGDKAVSFVGKTITQLTVTPKTGAAGAVDLDAAQLGPNGAFTAILNVVTSFAVPVLIGKINDTTGAVDMYVEGDFGSGFAATLQTALQALGASVGVATAVDLTGTTVTVVETFYPVGF